jgi:nitrogenase subunit NifH
MKKVKQIGIWMDHSNAFLMELTNNTIIESIVSSEFTQQEKEDSLEKNEKIMHNKEQHQQSSYYKKLCNAIINYKEVVLFGPTDAKSELFNLIRTDHLFKNIKIEVKNSDKMTAIEMHDFVREYFK